MPDGDRMSASHADRWPEPGVGTDVGRAGSRNPAAEFSEATEELPAPAVGQPFLQARTEVPHDDESVAVGGGLQDATFKSPSAAEGDQGPVAATGRPDASASSAGEAAAGPAAGGSTGDMTPAGRIRADGIGADGIPADGIQADGIRADGIRADRPHADGTPAFGTAADGTGTDRSAPARSQPNHVEHEGSGDAPARGGNGPDHMSGSSHRHGSRHRHHDPTRPEPDPADTTASPSGPRDQTGELTEGGRAGCTAPQLRRFIKSRAYVPMHELRRRFAIDGPEDDVTQVETDAGRVYIGLPEREGRMIADLLRQGEIGFELSLDPATPVVVGVYPMRPVIRA